MYCNEIRYGKSSLRRQSFESHYAQIPTFVKPHMIVIMEKKPKLTAETAENTNAK